jgi:ATP-dependent Clp protease protease subunit
MKNRPKLKPQFRAALQADGTLELLVYEDIGVDWWTGGGVTAKTVKDQIDQAGPFNTITVRINSPGGDAFEGVAIFNILRSSGKPVNVFVDGIAASAASIIAMAGDTRVMGAGSMLMIHNAWSSCVGYAEDMRKMADTLDKVSASVAETYISRAGVTKAKAKELMDSESWLSASESLELGLATAIAEPDEEETAAAMALARGFQALKRMKKVPESLKVAAPKAEDGDAMCSCYCAPCSDGRCLECECRGCDATDCAAENCQCAGSTQSAAIPQSVRSSVPAVADLAAADLTIFEAELLLVEMASRRN